jgi:hypothetical protein
MFENLPVGDLGHFYLHTSVDGLMQFKPMDG